MADLKDNTPHLSPTSLIFGFDEWELKNNVIQFYCQDYISSGWKLNICPVICRNITYMQYLHLYAWFEQLI